MPPIPSTTTNPPNDDIAAALRALNLRHAHLSTSSIPALAQSTSSVKDQQVLAAQAREDLDDYGRAVENLEALVEDLEREREKVAWRVVVHDWADKYARCVQYSGWLATGRRRGPCTLYRLDNGEILSYLRSVNEGHSQLSPMIYMTNQTILRLKADARTALLTSKRTIDINIKSRRDELLAGKLLKPKPDDEKTCVPSLST